MHWHAESVPRTDTPNERVTARLKLQQIHGVDEKRQYFEADGYARRHNTPDWP